MGSEKRVLGVVLLVLLLAIFCARSVTSMRSKSATWDETHYFAIGKYLLKNLEWDVQGCILHPPLSFYLQGVPLLPFETGDEEFRALPDEQRTPQILGLADVVRGQRLLAVPSNRDNFLLDLSRSTTILVGVLLGVLVYCWSLFLYGRRAAVLAAILYTFSPNILAHARLITPDLILTACWFGTLLFLWLSLSRRSLAHSVTAGFFLGLSLLAAHL